MFLNGGSFHQPKGGPWRGCPCRLLILRNANVACLYRLFIPMSPVEFKKWTCRMSLWPLCPCRVTNAPCRMSNWRNGPVALSILRVRGHKRSTSWSTPKWGGASSGRSASGQPSPKTHHKNGALTNHNYTRACWQPHVLLYIPAGRALTATKGNKRQPIKPIHLLLSWSFFLYSWQASGQLSHK